MCNPSDLGSECANPHDTRYFPERLLLFDRHPGGIGIAAQVHSPLGNDVHLYFFGIFSEFCMNNVYVTHKNILSMWDLCY
jgi:hypothetical protein